MPLLTCPCEKNAPMQPVNRHGVEIDVCTQCKGVWLDRGELEKLLSLMRDSDAEAAAPRPMTGAQPVQAPPARDRQYAPQNQGYGGERGEQGEYGEGGEGGHYDPRTGQYKRKKGFGIFDFFD